jgi:hypothetical protein
MNPEEIQNEMILSIPDRKSVVNIIAPVNPIALVIFLYEEGRNRKNRKSNLVEQVMPKLNFAVVSSAYCLQLSEKGKVKIKALDAFTEITEWIEKSEFKKLPLNIFLVGDGFSEIIHFTENHPDKIKGIVITGNSIPLELKDLKCKVPVLLLSAEFDKEKNDVTEVLLKQQENDNFELKIIREASRYFSELGKLGEAITVAGKWIMKNSVPSDI